MIKKCCVLILLLLFASLSFAQSAEMVSELIGSSSATYGQAAYLCGVSVGVVDEDASFEEAVAIFKDVGAIKSKVSADDNLKMADLANIVVHSWKIKPCLMYKVLPSGHYAMHTLKGVSVVGQSVDPGKKLSGHDVLFLISKCIDKFDAYSVSEFNAGGKK